MKVPDEGERGDFLVKCLPCDSRITPEFKSDGQKEYLHSWTVLCCGVLMAVLLRSIV